MKVLLCPLSDPGYLYPAIAVGQELARRQHEVSVIGRSTARSIAVHAGLTFLPSEEHSGPDSFRVSYWAVGGPVEYRAILRAARETRADVLITSALCHGALLAAEGLGIPVVVVGLAAYLWSYPSGGHDEPGCVTPRGWLTDYALGHYRKLRDHVGLPGKGDPAAGFPLHGDALLLRGHSILEHPGGVLPKGVHHIGPCFWEPEPDPAELRQLLAHLDQVGKPVVYVHLSRIFGGTSPWPRLNASFTNGPFQAVVEQGRLAVSEPAPDADILVVRKPWMGPLIERAGLVLTGGTSAPVLGALLHGRPLGVSPAGSEQPILARACVRVGVAVHLGNEVSPGTQAALEAAWDDQGMRDRAQHVGDVLGRAGGARRAADVVQAVVTGEPAAGAADVAVAHHLNSSFP